MLSWYPRLVPILAVLLDRTDSLLVCVPTDLAIEAALCDTIDNILTLLDCYWVVIELVILGLY